MLRPEAKRETGESVDGTPVGPVDTSRRSSKGMMNFTNVNELQHDAGYLSTSINNPQEKFEIESDMNFGPFNLDSFQEMPFGPSQ